MSTKLTVEQIGLVRRGSDIDVEVSNVYLKSPSFRFSFMRESRSFSQGRGINPYSKYFVGYKKDEIINKSDKMIEI